jgi:hypothetical protein
MKKKRRYIRPIISIVSLDNIITLQMGTPPANPPPRGGGSGKGSDTPFQSPFGDKPFG